MLLLDTNVVSELRKVRLGKGNANVGRWSDSIAAENFYVSAVTILELKTGVLRAERKNLPESAAFRSWLNDNILATFAGRILPIDTEVAVRAAILQAPRSRPIYDALIAATALVHGMMVVTRNVMDLNRWARPS